ncbi:MAG: TonB-dependent receptor plug domain-containing protein, partial [Prolixibacteraceae bacterium]|nr:TonB-dependent receptor plug domain-containing protein [Prolixibacteraceae bacterium]
MKPLWIFCLLCYIPSVLAQDNEQEDVLPDTLNTVWQMKYETLGKNHAHAITRISPDALCPAGNKFLVNGLYGMAPGALIQNTSFQPGTPPSVHIRGNHSPGTNFAFTTFDNFKWKFNPLAGEPIYLLDGMQIDANLFGGLNPDEIESVEIIRNLAGTIVYGQSGSNGVIRVKTKRPQKRGTSLVYNGYWGLQKQTNVARQMNGAECAEYMREKERNSDPPEYISPTPSLSEDMKIFSFDQDVWESLQMGYDNNGVYHPERIRSTDWTDLVSQTGSIHEQSLTLLHGTEKLRLTAAGNYFSNTGTVKGTGYDRYSGRILIEGDLFRWFSAGAQLWGSYSEQRLKSDMYTVAFRMNPLVFPYNKDGTLIESFSYNRNPLLYLNHYEDKTNSHLLSGRVFASFHPMKGLDIQLAYLPQIMKPKEQINDSRGTNLEWSFGENTFVEESRKVSAWDLSISYRKKIQRHLLGGSLSKNFKKNKINFDYQNTRTNGDYSFSY